MTVDEIDKLADEYKVYPTKYQNMDELHNRLTSLGLYMYIKKDEYGRRCFDYVGKDQEGSTICYRILQEEIQ